MENIINNIKDSISQLNYYIVGILLVYFIYISIMDVKHRRIPDKANLALLIARYILIPMGFKISISQAQGAVLLFITFFISGYITNMPIGGDIKCVTVLSLYYGLPLSIAVVFTSFLIGILFNVIVMTNDNKKKEYEMEGKHTPMALCFFISSALIYIIFQLI